MRTLPEEQKARRLAQVKHAVVRGHGYGWLASRWNISTVSALDWCARNVGDDDRRKLAENGRRWAERKIASGDTLQRLELVKMCRGQGWSDARLARAIGVTPSALCAWLKRHAPFGLDDALNDFRADQPEAA